MQGAGVERCAYTRTCVYHTFVTRSCHTCVRVRMRRPLHPMCVCTDGHECAGVCCWTILLRTRRRPRLAIGVTTSVSAHEHDQHERK